MSSLRLGLKALPLGLDAVVVALADQPLINVQAVQALLQAFAQRPAGTHLLQPKVQGLPGNPVSSFVTFLLLVRPFLLQLQGAAVTAPERLQLPAHFAWPRADKRREFLRVRRNAAGGLDLFPNQSSGVLTSVAWCDGLVDLPAGRTIARGDSVSFIPMAALLG